MSSGEITILQVNDAHGYLEPHAELLWDGDRARHQTDQVIAIKRIQ